MSQAKFLQSLAQWLIESHPNQLDEVAVILPSRRARIFLLEEIKKLSNQTMWLPSIKSMEDFISEMSELQTIDQLDLIMEFYQLYVQLEGEKAESLEEFMGWGNLLIHDFNEIDRNLIDGNELFTFLNEMKALDLWSPNRDELTESQKKYLGFWKRFSNYYDKLREHLIQKGLAYQGLLYRHAAERSQKVQPDIQDQYLYFAGFNALTPAEELLIEQLKEFKKVEMVWDADLYYLDDQMQEAGMFLRKRWKEDPELSWVSQGLLSGEKEIKCYGVPGQIGQSKLLAELLDNSKDAIEEKAVILADENMLLPVLESLPKDVAPLNITMGYPVHQSSYYFFFQNYIQLFASAEKLDKQPKRFYRKDLINFFDNPILSKCIGSNASEVLKALQDYDLPVVDLSVLRSHCVAETEKLFDPSVDLIDRLLHIVITLKESGLLDDIEMELLYHFYKLFNRLKDLHEAIHFSATSLLHIFKQHISKSQLSFVGEPLEGLQIMGVLESRTLDFDEVYITSLNEGVLPAGKSPFRTV